MQHLLTGILAAFFMGVTTLGYSQQYNHHVEVRAGANYTNVNYGTELLETLFSPNDYTDFQANTDYGLGHFVGVGASIHFLNHFEFMASVDYVRMNGQLSGQVEQLKDDVTRPPSSLVPVNASGTISHTFISIETGVRYTFGGDITNGFFIGGFISDMIHLDTEWRIDMEYETGNSNVQSDISRVEQPDYQNLTMVGGSIGYTHPIGDRFTVSPVLDYRYGFNPLVEQAGRPMGFNLGLGTRYWF
ncbi:MAG: outer membrane beta-barrel protein [Bacteroidota bacterium]